MEIKYHIMTPAEKVYQKLVDMALASSCGMQGDHAEVCFHRPGSSYYLKDIPDKFKPGKLLEFLSAEEREKLKELSSEGVKVYSNISQMRF